MQKKTAPRTKLWRKALLGVATAAAVTLAAGSQSQAASAVKLTAPTCVQADGTKTICDPGGDPGPSLMGIRW